MHDRFENRFFRSEHPGAFRWGGPPMGPGGPRGRGPRGGRARRGDVRAASLLLLSERPMHGYEMIQELDQRTQGMWRPSPGSVYPTLQMLEDEGLVTAYEADGKRLFTLTDEGRAEAERAKAGPNPWEQATRGVDPTAFQLRDVGWGLLQAARQVIEAGTDAEKARAIELLTDTRRRLYGILAEEQASGAESDDRAPGRERARPE